MEILEVGYQLEATAMEMEILEVGCQLEVIAMEILEVDYQEVIAMEILEVDYQEVIAMEILLVVAEREPRVVAVVEAAVKRKLVVVERAV